MRALCQLPAKLRIPEAFLSFAAAKKGNLTQSRKAAKRPASILRPVLSPNASRVETSSLSAFAPLRDQSLLATEDLAQSQKATKWRASTARFIQTPDNDDRKPFFLWGFVALCETNPPRFTRPISSDALRAMAAL
jgi:hypothetical protein